MRRRLALALASLCVLTLTAGCSGGGGGSTEVKTIEVTLEGDSATVEVSEKNKITADTAIGDEIDVDVNQPVDLVVAADRAGQIHVHSSPEQYFPFEEGANQPLQLQFDRPGKVEIEFHEPIDTPIVTLVVE